MDLAPDVRDTEKSTKPSRFQVQEENGSASFLLSLKRILMTLIFILKL